MIYSIQDFILQNFKFFAFRCIYMFCSFLVFSLQMFGFDVSLFVCEVCWHLHSYWFPHGTYLMIEILYGTYWNKWKYLCYGGRAFTCFSLTSYWCCSSCWWLTSPLICLNFSSATIRLKDINSDWNIQTLLIRIVK